MQTYRFWPERKQRVLGMGKRHDGFAVCHLHKSNRQRKPSELETTQVYLFRLVLFELDAILISALSMQIVQPNQDSGDGLTRARR